AGAGAVGCGAKAAFGAGGDGQADGGGRGRVEPAGGDEALAAIAVQGAGGADAAPGRDAAAGGAAAAERGGGVGGEGCDSGGGEAWPAQRLGAGRDRVPGRGNRRTRMSRGRNPAVACAFGRSVTLTSMLM